jgi:four helix bundle protein
MDSKNQNKIIPDYREYDSKKDFNGIDAWQKCRRVKLFIYNDIIPSLPAIEKYNLSIQLQRASVSITANIAEGYGRYNFREALRFYRIARGSLYETKDHLISCYDLGFIDSEVYRTGLNLIESAKTTLNGFINFVKNRMESK